MYIGDGCSNSMEECCSCVRNNGLAFEMMRLCLKGHAHVRNDVVVFERLGSCLKQCGCVRKDQLRLEKMQLCLEGHARV